MRASAAKVAAIGILYLMAGSGAGAQTKADQCTYYARNAMANTPTSTGVVRGAARGTVVGAITGHTGRGAAVGAAVGGTRRVVQKNRSYRYYYDSCMSR
jgi:hypothetical protein